MTRRGANWLVPVLLALASQGFADNRVAPHFAVGGHAAAQPRSSMPRIGGMRPAAPSFASPRFAPVHIGVPSANRSFAPAPRVTTPPPTLAGRADDRWRDERWHGNPYWRGGYWRGDYWPAVNYGVQFTWFLPVLPLTYVTYWYGNTPYYYTDNAYYTWDAGQAGYVATLPPPQQADSDTPDSPDATAASNDGASDRLFVYPSNGQDDQQQSIDRSECQQWAAAQTNADNPDYVRAEAACLTGRGYTVR